MSAPEVAESPLAAPRDASPRAPLRRRRPAWSTIALIGVLTAAGAIVRAVVARQSIFADELSSYWISATHGIGGVLSLMYGIGAIRHAEITPPVSFVLSWLTTRAGHAPQLLRLPELVGGIITIPAVYALGERVADRRTAVVAAALTTLSPFMIYYSAEARAYGLMMLGLTVSTLAILRAIETRRAGWWVLYAAAAWFAFLSHYTAAFVLAVQFVWAFWTHPPARRPLVVANLGAAAALIPWLPGLIRDLQSPTLKILSALSPFNPHEVRIDLEHWAVGYPYTLAGGLRALPGTPALILLAASLAFTLAGIGLVLTGRAGAGQRSSVLDSRAWRRREHRLTLVVLLMLATPVLEAVVSVGGNHVFGVRNLAASWPYLALVAAAVLTAPPAPVAVMATALTVIAFGLGVARMLEPRFQRPDYQGAATYVEEHARGGDVVVDETGSLSPGPLTGLDVALHRRLPIFRAQAPAERGHPYGFADPIIPLQRAVGQAVAVARGHRVFLVTNVFRTNIVSLRGRINPAPSQFPAHYRLTAEQRFAGIGGTLVAVYSDTAR